MIKLAATLVTLLYASTLHAQTITEKLCIIAAAQDLPRVPGLEIKASRITAPPPDYTKNGDITYLGAELDVVAAGQSMTFGFACGTSAQQQTFTRPLGIIR
jgi:hypothetical protein